jgi:hypothetical protein
MNQYECARRWASKDRKHSGKAGRYMFYEGDTIYSYGHHWPLARKVALSDSGREVALMNDGRCSHSTDRHASLVRSAAHRAGIDRVDLEADLFDTVIDEASLAHARHITVEHAKDQAYENRLAAQERAKRDRENNGDKARRDLESLLGVDMDPISLSAAVKLRNLLLGVESNNFRAGRSWHGRQNGIASTHPAIIEGLAAAINEDPSRLKTPGFLLTLIENFKLLAA